MVHQHVHHVLELVDVVGGEEAAADHVDALAQLGDLVVVLVGVVAARLQSFHLALVHAWGGERRVRETPRVTGGQEGDRQTDRQTDRHLLLFIGVLGRVDYSGHFAPKTDRHTDRQTATGRQTNRQRHQLVRNTVFK